MRYPVVWLHHQITRSVNDHGHDETMSYLLQYFQISRRMTSTRTVDLRMHIVINNRCDAHYAYLCLFGMFNVPVWDPPDLALEAAALSVFHAISLVPWFLSCERHTSESIHLSQVLQIGIPITVVIELHLQSKYSLSHYDCDHADSNDAGSGQLTPWCIHLGCRWAQPVTWLETLLTRYLAAVKYDLRSYDRTMRRCNIHHSVRLSIPRSSRVSAKTRSHYWIVYGSRLQYIRVWHQDQQ